MRGDTDRLLDRIGGVVGAKRIGLALMLVGCPGIIFEGTGGAPDIAPRLGKRLAAVEHFRHGQALGIFTDQDCGLRQDAPPLGG